MNLQFYDPLYGQVGIPEAITPLVNSYWFRRLQYLRQLGLCYLCFPGGNHTRFEHSIGTFFLARLVGETPLVKDLAPQFDEPSRKRFSLLLQLSALSHDLGHGPFSHMTENVLIGLGATVTHEDMSAAIVTHHLQREFRPFRKHGVEPKVVGQIITKEAALDPSAQAAKDLISSDLDLDRIDYLHRDSHYSGVGTGRFVPEHDLVDVWRLRHFRNTVAIELTNRGIKFAERVLFMRRTNYQEIVFHSDHMCATAMFEKAVWIAYKERNSEFGKRCKDIIALRHHHWAERAFKKHIIPVASRLYSLVDYEALQLLAQASSDAQYIVRRIRQRSLYRRLGRWNWSNLHFLAKQKILSMKREADAFGFRRRLEEFLAAKVNESDIHIVVHLALYKHPRGLSIGASGGRLLEESSALANFFKEDYVHSYAIELYYDPVLSQDVQNALREMAEDMFVDGNIEITG